MLPSESNIPHQPTAPCVDEQSAQIEGMVKNSEQAEPVIAVQRDAKFGAADQSSPFPNPLWHPLRAMYWIWQLLFGSICLILLLAIVAAVPILNFLAFGYLLEIEGRIARTGQFRNVGMLLALSRRTGCIAFGIWFWLGLSGLIAGAASDAMLIDPAGGPARVWNGILFVSTLFVIVHLSLALARGGMLGCFFRPIKNLRWFYTEIRQQQFLDNAEKRFRDFISHFQFMKHFWLGLRGFAGAFLWILIPTALLAVRDPSHPPVNLIAILGGAILIPVLSWLPYLQARFAAEDRFGAMFEWQTIRELFCRAPITWFVTTLIFFALAVPLFLLKIRLPPRDAAWLITTIFIASALPAKMLAGWAYHRALHKESRAWRVIRWPFRILTGVAVAIYIFILYFTPAISEHGIPVLFEQHALLLPAPY